MDSKYVSIISEQRALEGFWEGYGDRESRCFHFQAIRPQRQYCANRTTKIYVERGVRQRTLAGRIHARRLCCMLVTW